MFVFWVFRDKYDIDNQQRAIFLSHPPRQKAMSPLKGLDEPGGF